MFFMPAFFVVKCTTSVLVLYNNIFIVFQCQSLIMNTEQNKFTKCDFLVKLKYVFMHFFANSWTIQSLTDFQLKVFVWQVADFS